MQKPVNTMYIIIKALVFQCNLLSFALMQRPTETNRTLHGCRNLFYWVTKED